MADELLEAIQRAAKDLPSGFSIQITVEKGHGDVRLITPSGDDLEDSSLWEESFACQVHGYVNAAREFLPEE